MKPFLSYISSYFTVVLVLCEVIGALTQCNKAFTYQPLPGAPKCVDGTSPGYFIDQVNDTDKFVIWLGDSDLCANTTDCATKCNDQSKCSSVDLDNFDPSNDIQETIDCYYADLTCGSSRYASAVVRGETLLCGDNGAPLQDFTRIYIPQCSKDWFLGKGDGINATTLFNGALILEAVLNDITGLSTASRVIWGGTRGGAIGALNQYDLIESLTAVDTEIYGVFDSAWFVRIAEFGVNDFSDEDKAFSFNARLKAQSANWISNSAIASACALRWQEDLRFNCLYAAEIVSSAITKEQKIFFYHSQYDLLTLAQNGLADEGKESSFGNDVSFASNAIRFIEQYGASIRLSIENSNAVDPERYHFSTACGQYGPLLPISVEAVNRTSEEVGSAGEFSFERTGTTWETISVDGLSLRDAVVTWIEGNGSIPYGSNDPPYLFDNKIRGDRCGAFLCNDACPSAIIPFKIETLLAEEINTIIALVAAGFLGANFVFFLIIFLQVRGFRFSLRGYWSKKKKAVGSEEFSLQDELRNVNFQRKVVALSVRNVSYFVKRRKESNGFFSRNKKSGEIQILHGVSLALRPGELHALMGPSGSGKSTMLDIMSNIRNIGRIDGTHFINGVPSHLPRAKFLVEWLRHNLGYVRQTDVLFPKLTVKEHLTHAAWLMLPESMKTKEKLNRVWLVTRLLELQEKIDVIIGDGGVRIEGGLSGGQRRRVSVATQLLKFPAALVLDEPTSGLDSANALLLIKALRSIAETAKLNIFLTIHQPRREIFEQLNRLTILVKGKIAFSGSPNACARFFNLNADEVNIGDDILDTLKQYEIEEKKLAQLFEIYENSDFARKVQRHIKEEESNLGRNDFTKLRNLLKKQARKEGRRSWNKATGTRSTLTVMMSRTLKRGGFDVLRSGLISGIAGAVIGAIFLDANTYTGKTALAYLTLTAATFISFTFLAYRYKSEKIMWEHERESGTEISWVALLTSQYVRNVVSGCIEGGSFTCTVYWIGGLNNEVGRFLITLLLVALTSVAVIAQNTTVDILLIGRGTRMEDRISIVLNMTLLCFGVLFNGFIIPLGDLPIYYRWCSYFLVTFWGFVGVLINNFRDFEFPCDLSKLECATRTANNQVIRRFGYEVFDVYICIAVLVGFIALFKIISTFIFYFRYVRKRAKLTRSGGEKMEGPEAMGKTMTMLLRDADFNDFQTTTESAGYDTLERSYKGEEYGATQQSSPAYSKRNPFITGPPPSQSRSRSQMQITMDDV